jgi:hypothetical protein
VSALIRRPTIAPPTRIADGLYNVCPFAGGLTAGSLVANSMHYTPIAGFNMRVNRIACEVTTAVAASKARMAIVMAAASNTMPDALLVDAGEVDTATTGMKELSFTETILGDRLYWLVLWVSSTASFRVASLNVTAVASIGQPSAFSANANSRVNGSSAYSSAGVFPTSVAGAGLARGTGNVPHMGVRKV